MGDETRPPKVLVVEDVPEHVFLLQRVLEPEGYELHAVDCGNAALRAVAADPPDLILLDLMMPNMDGFEVCARLQEEPATRDIPVIILTAYGINANDRERGLLSGATDYLFKPVDYDDLLVRIRKILRQRGE